MCEHCSDHSFHSKHENHCNHNENHCGHDDFHNNHGYYILLSAGIAFALLIAALIFNTVPHSAAGAFTMSKFPVNLNQNIVFLLFLSAYLISGIDIVILALKNITKGRILDENFLMSTASLGAFCLGEYPEAVSVMILYKIGEFLQHRAVNKSRCSISKLMDIRPEYANVEENGILIQKNPDEIAINDIIIVKAGEKIPLDGIITEGYSFIDTSSITGESVLKEVKQGDEVLSGTINKNGVLKIKVNKLYKDSTVSKILELVENAASRKSITENFITKFAKYYTPAVVVCAVLIILIPLCFCGAENIESWIKRALTFLVISCPCALVISVPLTFYGGIGAASKCGILVKGSSYLELLSNPDTIVFDKTGTLTCGTFEVTDIITENNISKTELLEYAAAAELFSNHPAAVSIKKEYGKLIDNSKVKNAVEIEGNGVKADVNSHEILAGNKKLMEKFNVQINPDDFCNLKSGTRIYAAKDRKYAGCLIISDKLKENAKSVIEELKNNDIKSAMLTGDSVQNAEQTAKELNIKNYYAELLPAGKAEKLAELISKKRSKKSVIFVGDGINDAPVLMQADIGIAMGALGSDAAIEAADIVISDDNLSKIYKAVLIAKKTILIAKQNIIFALGIKVLFLILGAFGLMSMWGAVFADVGVTLAAVLNSLRTLKVS